MPGVIDEKKYGRLLAKHLPAAIQSDEEQDRLADVLMHLTIPPRELTPEEARLVRLLEVLVDEYEERRTAMAPKATPLELLEGLIEFGKLRQADLVDVFGSQGNVSQVLAGRRKINLDQARRLSKRFHIPVERFI
jgi:HTH-type transcriptional regulator/antitoxin HigA